jgi:hypothetical protein
MVEKELAHPPIPPDDPNRTLTLCPPAGMDRFFIEVGVPVATRTTAPPTLNEKQMGEFLEKRRRSHLSTLPKF